MNTKYLEQVAEVFHGEVASGRLKGCSVLVYHKKEKVFQ